MSAYYNDNDPYAAEWLRNLIAAGHLPDGDVDDRSVADVRADDLTGYTAVHLFAGIGGWPRALRLAGWDDTRPVWTASCPCPPFSSAGRKTTCPECASAALVWHPGRTGFAVCASCGYQWEADPRHLWPEALRIVAECRPPVVFGEQVAGSDGMDWLAGVRGSLEILGYAVGAADAPAAGVGAPHIRQRIWWVADASGNGWREERAHPRGGTRGGDAQRDGGRPRDRDGAPAGTAAPPVSRRGVADAQRDGIGVRPGTGTGNDDRRQAPGRYEGDGERRVHRSPAHGLGDADEQGHPRRPSDPGVPRAADGTAEREEPVARGHSDGLGDATDELGVEGLPLRAVARGEGDAVADGGAGHWGSYRIADGLDGRLRRVGDGVQPLAHGLPVSVGSLRARLPGLDGLASAPGAAAALKRAKRYRRGVLSGAGNAIVPQVAAVFVAAYMEVLSSRP